MRWKKVPLAVLLAVVLLGVLVAPGFCLAGGLSLARPHQIWVHFNPKYFGVGHNLPVYDDRANVVGWLSAKDDPEDTNKIDVRWSWDGIRWTPPFVLDRNLCWSAYNEPFRTDFIAFFSNIGLVLYCVDFREDGAPEGNWPLPSG